MITIGYRLAQKLTIAQGNDATINDLVMTTAEKGQ